MNKTEMEQRYAYHSEAMGNAMREARALLDASSQSDLTPDVLAGDIENVIETLKLAEYHTQRMAVFHRLLERKLS